MRVGIVGATGIVGRELLKLLADSSINISELRLSASSGSVGKRIPTHLGENTIQELSEDFFANLDFCFFCVSSDLSLKWVPAAAARGTVCIDNSSAFRMEAETPIIIPEVNGELLKSRPRIIANPNCCVAQLAVALQPISRHFGLEEVFVSTYQSVSGAGQRAVEKLHTEINLYPQGNFISGQYLLNVLPFIGWCDDNGHCQEELKIIAETRKVLGQPGLPMAVTAARVPVLRGHCQAVSFRTWKETSAEAIRQALNHAPNIVVQDSRQYFPQPITAQHTNQVYVGRIRENTDFKSRSFSFWVVADNLRKGAAHNALSIAETWCSLL